MPQTVPNFSKNLVDRISKFTKRKKQMKTAEIQHIVVFILSLSLPMTLLLASFLAGILTILAPCVLPVLPVVLAGSLGEKQKWYPYLVILSLAVSIVLFTLVLKVSTIFIDIPQNFWKYLSGGILMAL